MKVSTDQGLQKENWFYVEFYRKVEEPDIFLINQSESVHQETKSENRDF